MLPSDVTPGMVFHDDRPYCRTRKVITPRHLFVTSVEEDPDGKSWAICRTVETGQTNTRMLCSSLVKYRLVAQGPGRILTLSEVRTMLEKVAPESVLNRRGRGGRR